MSGTSFAFIVLIRSQRLCSIFSEGLDAADDVYSGLMGYRGKNGEWVIKPEFERTQSFSEGLGAIRKDNQWRFMDKNGRIIFQSVTGSIIKFPSLYKGNK